MPKSTDPTLLASSQSVNVTSAGDILRAHLDKQRGVYTSAQIYDGPSENFYDTDLGSKLDQLEGALPARINRLGTLNLTETTNPIGVVDWGAFKQADGPVWERQETVSVGFGSYISAYYKNDSSLAYPYFREFKPSGDSTGSQYRSDPIFNVGINEDIPVVSSSLPGSGPGSAHLCSTYKTQPLGDEREIRPVNLVYDNMGMLGGITISGIISPADRGTVALLRIEEGQTDWLTPSTTAEEIMSKVVAVVNLGQGLETTRDGQPGGIFTIGDAETFPSADLGQYDLSEIQRGTYRADHPDLAGDPIAGITANAHAGAVRLLRDPSALYGETHPGGNLPVLFGTEMWDFDTESFFNYTGDSEEDLNFLAYRLPRLTSYLPSDLPTPLEERGRFFLPIRPNNQAEGAYFTSAGAYAGYAESTVSDQIARFRYTVKYKQIKAGLEASASSATFNEQNYSLGSFVLVHFKTEEAFERLVRDAEIPSADDLWSVNAVGIPYDGADNTTSLVTGSALNEYGISSALERLIVTGVQGSTVQNAQVVTASSKYGFSLTKTYNYITSISNEDVRFTTISGVHFILPRTQGYFHTNGFVYGENKEGSEEIATLALGMSLRAEESSTATNGLGHTLNWRHPFYTYSTEASTRPELTDDPNYTYQTLPYGRLLFNNLTSGKAIQFVGESAPNEPAFFLDSDFTSERLREGALDLEYTLFSNATDRDDVYSTPVVIGFRGVYPLGDGGLETERPPVFMSDFRLTTALFNPAKHEEGLGIELLQDTSYVDGGAFSGNPYGNPLLYHSARMKSLLQDCTIDTINLVPEFNALNKDALAFFIYRLDGGGAYSVVQTLTINGAVFELCSGEANPYGGTYSSDIPIYRPVDNNGYSGGAVAITFDAVLNYDYKVHVAGGLGYSASYPAFDSYFFAFVNRAQISVGDFSVMVDGDVQGLFNVVGDTNANFGVTVDYGMDFKTDFSGVYTDVEYLDTSTWQTRIDHNNTFYALEVYDTEADEMSHYGNFYQTDSGAISIYGNPSNYLIPYQGGFDARKDTSERFLDEMYRISCAFAGFSENVTSDQGNTVALSDLLAYGNVLEQAGEIQTWTGALDFTFTVRDSYYYYNDFNPVDIQTPNHRGSGWVRNGYNLVAVTFLSGQPEAQVGPMPFLYNANGTSAYASLSRGQLLVPEEAYDTDYRPSANAGDSVTQPDFSAGNTNVYPIAQAGDLYSYMRMFDVSFGYNEEVTNEFTIRLIGIRYEDLNPDLTSSENNTSIPMSADNAQPFSVLIQNPTKTAWLNVARPDEPAKAGGGTTGFVTYPGCMLSYENKVMVKEAVVCVDIRVSLGSYVVEAYGSNYPILVKANVANTFDYSSCKMSSFDPNQPYLLRKGLIGIEILRESTGLNYDGDEVVSISEYTGLEAAL